MKTTTKKSEKKKVSNKLTFETKVIAGITFCGMTPSKK